MYVTSRSVAAVSLPPFAAVAAMERASISATAAIWPSPGLEPSRLGKLRVVCRMENSPLAGVSPAPKHGPQKHSRKMTPAEIRSKTRPVLTSDARAGMEPG